MLRISDLGAPYLASLGVQLQRTPFTTCLPEINMKDDTDQRKAVSTVQPPPTVELPSVSSGLSGNNSATSNGEASQARREWTTWPFRIGLASSRPVADHRGTAPRGEIQLITYNATLRKHTRLTIRPVLLLLFISFLVFFALTLLSVASFLLSALVSSLLAGSPSFHHVNSILLTMLFFYSLFKQFLEYLRTLVQPRRRVPVNLQPDGATPDHPPVLFHEKSWWSTWNEKDRPR
ncbi:hypothetical protein CC2G_004622 [Coprinopsis cinerea AmutBmut pab1-1]|nr:hypothetical protein CC2G_004622 [Coprinopsis cinerea AmutBmut pab1-1]